MTQRGHRPEDRRSFPEHEIPELRARLFAKVMREPSGCWLWTGYRKVAPGYGAISIHNRLFFVHRLSWILHHGPIPEGMHVCHRCDVPNCVRPEHLFLGTHQENVEDMLAKGRGSTPPVHIGEAHPKVVVGDARVAEVRARWAANPGDQRALAREYGVSQSTIWRWIHGATRTTA